MNSAENPLLFQKPDFHPGVNVTVRSGAKWFGTLNIGDLVAIAEIDGEDGMRTDRGKHLVLGVAYFNEIEEIPEDLLRFEHDPTCRTPDGLEEELGRIYGDDVMSNPDKGFSVVVFYYVPDFDETL